MMENWVYMIARSRFGRATENKRKLFIKENKIDKK